MMLQFRMFLLALVAVSSTNARNSADKFEMFAEKHKSYFGYNLQQKSQRAIERLKHIPGIVFWDRPKRGINSTVLVPPMSNDIFMDMINYEDLDVNYIINNVPRWINLQKKKIESDTAGIRSCKRKNFRDFTNNYLRYDEIITYLKNAVKSHSNIAKLKYIGKTAEGRNIPLVHISSNFSAQKPILAIEGGIHAREWLSHAMALYTISKLLSDSHNLLKKHDWYIVPVANPDGYEYSITKDHNWRKNRSLNPYNARCIGADLNRNFDIYWSLSGTSSDACNEIYPGYKPNSERETLALINMVKKARRRIQTYICLHSFGKYILYPWGSISEPHDSANGLLSCARKASQKFEESGEPGYSYGQSATLLYPASGGADDYMVAKMGVKRSYTVELPGGENDAGFQPHPSEIHGLLSRNFPGIMTLAICSE